MYLKILGNMNSSYNIRFRASRFRNYSKNYTFGGGFGKYGEGRP
jgi:hypothetical protein